MYRLNEAERAVCEVARIDADNEFVRFAWAAGWRPTPSETLKHVQGSRIGQERRSPAI